MATMHYRAGAEAAPGYKLIELLGRGGFGEVWKAQGPGGVILAVKIIDKVDDKAGRKEFRALKLIRNLRHPNLVSISGFWIRDAEGKLLDPEKLADDAEGDPTIRPSELVVAMDLGEMSLLERLEECRKGLSAETKGGIPAEELIEYMEAAARAIDYLNIRHDIQHRDIKPQNILIVGGSAQVCDFGLASAVSSVRTSMGGAGSLAYMAPEIYSTKRPSRSTDQYGLAIAYVELRTGRLPLADIESYAVLDEAKRMGKLDLSWLDEEERKVIERATALNAEERFARCVDMVQALRSALSPTTATVNPRTTDPVRPIGDYQPDHQVYRRAGEEIWQAVSPERHRVMLVVRDVAESPELAAPLALAVAREASKHHPRLAEIYEFVRLSETGKVVPARLFDGPNPPGFSRLLLAGRLCPGNMNDRMTSGGLSAGQLIDEMEQLAEGVDFLNDLRHERGGKKVRLVHLNVRPANFQLNGHEALLSNFSSCQLLEGDEAPFPAGRQIADSAYNAPELGSDRITRWTDQYQLAVAYLQMRTGKPSSGLTGSHGGERHASGGPRLDLSDLQPREREVVARATSVAPSERFDNCTLFVDALRKAWTEDRAISGLPSEQKTVGPKSGRGDQPTLLPDNKTIIAPDRLGELASPVPAVAAAASQAGETPQSAVAIAGTMIAPRVAETVIQPDTDPGSDATDNRPQPAGPQQPARRPQRAAEVVPPPPRAAEGRFAKLRHLALAGLVVGSAGLAGYQFFFSSATGISRELDERIAAGNYLGAYKYIDDEASGLSEDAKKDFRLKVQLAWFDQHIKPLVEERKYADAVKEIRDVDPALAPADLAEQWRKEVVGDWYTYATKLSDDGRKQSAALQFNGLVRTVGVYANSVASRTDAIDALLRSGASDIAKKPDDAFATLTQAVDAIDDAKGVKQFPPEEERTLRRRALVNRARAAARLKRWDKVKDDLKTLTGQLVTREEVAVGKLLELLADTAGASVSDRLARATTLQQSSAGDLGLWEKEELSGLIVTLQRALGGARYQEFQGKLAAAQKAVDDGKFADAAATMQTILTEDAYRPFLKGADKQRADELAALVALARLDAQPNYAPAAMTLAEQAIAESPSTDARLVQICQAIANRATERTAGAQAARRWPELLDRAVSALAKAKSRTKAGSPTEKQLQDVVAMLGDEFRRDLKAVRDQAGNAATASANADLWTKLGSGAARAEELGLADRFTRAAGIESQLEQGKLAMKLDEAARRLAPQSSSGNTSATPATAADDDRYARFVLGRAYGSANRDRDASEAFIAAFAPSKPGEPESKWQQTKSRRRAAAETLAKAALLQKTGPDHDPTLGETASNDRFTAAAAAAAFRLLSVARPLASGDVFDAKKTSDAELLKSLADNYVLAAAYNPATAEEGLKLTDAAIDSARDDAPTQLYVANLRLHGERYRKTKQKQDRDRLVIAAGRLLTVCEAKYFDVKALALFDRVIAPAFGLVQEAGDSLSEPAQLEGARIAGARGRLVRSLPALEDRFADDVSGADQVAYDSFTLAAKLDPKTSDYYLGAGMSYHDLLIPTAERKSEVLRQNATAVEKNAKSDDDRNLARGLRGLATYQESVWSPDYDVKRSKLQEAVGELAAVAAAATNQRAHADVYHALRVVEGGAFLHLANYVESLEEKAKYLEKAKAVAQAIVDGGANRLHPEWALLLWGNTEEDMAMFLGDESKPMLAMYDSAQKRFTAALAEADDNDDLKGRSTALVGRGRCRYRQALKDSKDDQERRQRLNAAIDDLRSSIDAAAKWPVLQAEGQRWLAEIYQHPLTADFAKATDGFAKAAALAKPINPSWPLYELKRADNALHFAAAQIDPANLKRPQPQVVKLLDDARAVAQGLLDETKDPRIHARHRVQAQIVLIQADLWEADVERAAAKYDQMAAKLAPEDAFSFAVGAADAIIDVPGTETKKRRMTADEAALSRRAIDDAMKVARKVSLGDRIGLFRTNSRYYSYWNPLFAAAFKKAQDNKNAASAATDRREALDLMHDVRFHMATAVKLEATPDWKTAKINPLAGVREALVNYTKFLLDETQGETDWNQPGRDKARYKAEAGL
jgi:serine/threonine protein kinase